MENKEIQKTTFNGKEISLAALIFSVGRTLNPVQINKEQVIDIDYEEVKEDENIEPDNIKNKA